LKVLSKTASGGAIIEGTKEELILLLGDLEVNDGQNFDLSKLIDDIATVRWLRTEGIFVANCLTEMANRTRKIESVVPKEKKEAVPVAP